jgi:hypothetical protein
MIASPTLNLNSAVAVTVTATRKREVMMLLNTKLDGGLVNKIRGEGNQTSLEINIDF